MLLSFAFAQSSEQSVRERCSEKKNKYAENLHLLSKHLSLYVSHNVILYLSIMSALEKKTGPH